ncbi:hypothetical protein SAMN05216338_100297 [Bradyrhizobium sp. Rc2d]|nr:hypothetical protein SAMN05216338_100297 [Bradyrhizobium sp. Rc2d]
MPMMLRRTSLDANLPKNSAQALRLVHSRRWEVRQRGGKRVIAFASEGHFDPVALTSNTFDIEWPPRSGRRQSFPEVDRAEWFDIELARTKMLSAQVEFLDRLLAIAVESAGK